MPHPKLLNKPSFYRKFAQIGLELKIKDLHHFGATYMFEMIGHPTLDLMLFTDHPEVLKGQALQCSFDKRLRLYRVGDVFFYVGQEADRKELMQYIYLTEFINVTPSLKEELIQIKLGADDMAKRCFFNRVMPKAIAWGTARKTKGLDPNELCPLPSLGTELVLLKNIVTRPNIIAGDYTYVHSHKGALNFEEENVLYQWDPSNYLRIGKFCSIADEAKFIMSSANHQIEGSTYPFAIFSEHWQSLYKPKYPHRGDTLVGNDVWICYNALIMPGVTIGDGAIIAANATVVNDVPPYSVVGGNPAKILKYRFEPDIIEFYLQLRWWDWPIAKIEQHMQAIVENDVGSLRLL